MASDRLARQLLNMTTDPNVADPVKLAAIKDALDRSGLAAKNAVSVEVGISKPFERVFDSIMAGPRYPQTPPALVAESESPAIESGDDSEIVGEFDDDEIEDDPGIHRESESDYTDVLDVEIMSDQPTTPGQGESSASVDLGASLGSLGATAPVGSGLMSITEANEAAAAMRAREAARVRNMRRR